MYKDIQKEVEWFMLARNREKCTIFDIPYANLDKRNVALFKKNILNVYLSSPYKDMILNMTKVTYIDAVGLEALLFAGSLVQEADGKISLYGLSSTVRQILMKTRLYRYFDINRSEEDCLEFLKDAEYSEICNYTHLRTKLKAQLA